MSPWRSRLAIAVSSCARSRRPGQRRQRAREEAHARRAVEAGRRDSDQLQHAASAGDGEDRRHASTCRRSRSRRRPSAIRSCRTATTATPAKAPVTCSSSTRTAICSPTCRSAKARSITRAASTTTANAIWVPVAEYRPNSRAIIYRVDPATMKATEVFRYGDHIGGLVHNTDDNTLHGVSWGSRRFYTLDARRQGTRHQRRRRRRSNCASQPSGYIDYQDCKYLGRQRDAVLRPQQVPDEEGRPALSARRLRDRRPRRQSRRSSRCRSSCGRSAACR